MRKTTLYVALLIHSLLVSQAHAGFLTDLDGFDISLFADGSASNLFGPDSFTIGYNPITDFNPFPAPMPDGSEMDVELTDTSILITQGTFFDLATTDGWTMRFDGVDFTSSITDAIVAMSNFPGGLTTMVSANSVEIRFDGGVAIGVDDEWTSTIDVITDAGVVSEPGTLALLGLGMLGAFGLIRRRPV